MKKPDGSHDRCNCNDDNNGGVHSLLLSCSVVGSQPTSIVCRTLHYLVLCFIPGMSELRHRC